MMSGELEWESYPAPCDGSIKKVIYEGVEYTVLFHQKWGDMKRDQYKALHSIHFASNGHYKPKYGTDRTITNYAEAPSTGPGSYIEQYLYDADTREIFLDPHHIEDRKRENKRDKEMKKRDKENEEISERYRLRELQKKQLKELQEKQAKRKLLKELQEKQAKRKHLKELLAKQAERQQKKDEAMRQEKEQQLKELLEKQAKRKQKKAEENVQPEPEPEQPEYYSSEWCEQNSEGMDIQIAIPSHDRFEILREKALKLLSHHHFPMCQVNVFVAESEYEKYLPLEEEYGLKLVRSADTLLGKRNHIIQFFPEGTHVVEIDDKVKDIFCLSKPVRPVEDLQVFLLESFQKLSKWNKGMWGIQATTNSMNFKGEGHEVSMGLYHCCATFCGYINDRSIVLTMPVMEDYERVCLFHENADPILKRCDHGIECKYWDTKGGLQSDFKKEVRFKLHTQCAIDLVAKYPNLCSLKDEKGKKEGMKGIRFKYRSSLNYSEEEDELFHDNLDEDQGKKEEGKKDEKEKKEAKQNGRDPNITKREAKKPKDISRDQACLDGPISYERMFEILESIGFPWQTRKNISDEDVLGFNLGVTDGRAKHGIVVGNAVLEREVLADVLGRFIRQHKPDFKYTSIQVNKNVTCNLHVDGNNLGASYIIGVGDYGPVYFDGGSVWVQDRGALDCHDKWVEFDGNIPHSTICPYKGTRYTLVYYTSGGYDKLGKMVASKFAETGSMKGLAGGGTPEKCEWIKEIFNFPESGVTKGTYEQTPKKRMDRARKEFDVFLSMEIPTPVIDDGIAKALQFEDAEDDAARSIQRRWRRWYDYCQGGPFPPQVLLIDFELSERFGRKSR